MDKLVNEMYSYDVLNFNYYMVYFKLGEFIIF